MAIWKLMQHHGFPNKYIAIIQQLYEDATCQAKHEGKLTDPFQVETGVCQGCILSPTKISVGGGLDYTAVHKRPENRHPVDIRQTTRRP